MLCLLPTITHTADSSALTQAAIPAHGQDAAAYDLATDITALVTQTRDAFTTPDSAATKFETLREAWSRVLVLRSLDFDSYQKSLEKNFSAQGLGLSPHAPVWKLFGCQDVADVTTRAVHTEGQRLITLLEHAKKDSFLASETRETLQDLHATLFANAPLALGDTQEVQNTAQLLLTAVRQSSYAMREPLSLTTYQHFHQGKDTFDTLIKTYKSTLDTLQITPETAFAVITLCCLLKEQQQNPELLETLLATPPFNDTTLTQVNGDTSWTAWAQSWLQSVPTPFGT